MTGWAAAMLAAPAFSATLLGGPGPAAISATLAGEPVSATLAGSAPSGTLASGGSAPSATLAAGGTGGGTSLLGSLSEVQLRKLYLPGVEQAGITIPDGEARMTIQNRIGQSTYRVGGTDNFVTGRIQAWFTDAIPLLADGTQLQLSASDDIGLGPLYLKQNYIERTQSVPVGLARKLPFGSVLLSLQRQAWKLGQLDPPNLAEEGLIDSWGVQFDASELMPDLAESQLPERPRREATVIKFRRAFAGLGGNYTFDRVEADLRQRLPGLRAADGFEARVLYGQAWDVEPSLPLRETFGLGGADALRGYHYEEFRGNGLVVFRGEYALSLPWTLDLPKARLFFHQTDLLLFGESGRVQDDWWVGQTPYKWSAGLGLRAQGQILHTARAGFRVYAAEAGERPWRAPIVYILADVNG